MGKWQKFIATRNHNSLIFDLIRFFLMFFIKRNADLTVIYFSKNIQSCAC